MPSLRDAIEYIANNDDQDLGDDDTGYIISVCLVAELFGRTAREIAWAVGAERRGGAWRLGRKYWAGRSAQ